MGSNQPSQIIRNRHFTNLQIRSSQSPEKSQMIGSVNVASNTFLQAWNKKLQLARKQVHNHMLLPIHWKVAESSLCGSNKIIEIEYQKFNRLLSQEVRVRGEQNRHLEESEIWYLTWALTEVVYQCSSFGQRVNDLSLSNIFMNETGNIKILTPFSLPDAFDPYFEPIIKDIYFSPEELKGRLIGQMHNESDSIKSSSFAIGMLLLSLGLLKPLYYLYDYDKNQLNYQKLAEELDNLSKVQFFSSQYNIYQSYTDSFQLLIRKLLQQDPSNRVSATQIYEGLSPFINEIAMLKAFDFTVPKPAPVSPPRKNTKGPKETISLRSHKAKESSLLTPNANSNIKSTPSNEVSPPPLVESKYVTENSNLGSGLQLLRKIDQRLQRSREQFPS